MNLAQWISLPHGFNVRIDVTHWAESRYKASNHARFLKAEI